MTQSIHTPIPTARIVENVKNMLIEIQRMKDYCKHYYDQGGDVMVECWDTGDYEDLFYSSDFDIDPNSATCGEHIRTGRISFANAWSDLKHLMQINAERQADAQNSEF